MSVRVLVVDDSAFMRRQLTTLLEEDGRIEVVGIARNGVEAVERTAELAPDVVTLDINMPVMDGLTALDRIMRDTPTACVMISSLTQEGADTSMQALELGAVDCVGKPSGTVSLDIAQQAELIRHAVKGAARARVTAPSTRARVRRARSTTRPAAAPAGEVTMVVAIGVSTGGPQTLLRILPELPADFPAAILIVQHMPPGFTASLARRLDESCEVAVKEASHNEPLRAGTVYIAPGGQHLSVVRSTLGRGPMAQLSTRPSGMQFCPSVDVLFRSVASLFGARAVGVMLTGMGDDGADAMVDLKNAGAHTIAESEESAIVYGMPREAVQRGAVRTIAPADTIGGHIQEAIRRISRDARI